MKDIFTTLCIQFTNRSTPKKKLRFLNWLTLQYQKEGYHAEVLNDKTKFSRVCDVVYGDIRKAKKVLLIPYDTPQKYLLPHGKYYPINGYANRKVLFHNLLFQTVISLTVMVIAIGISFISMNEESTFRFVVRMISFLLFIGGFWLSSGIKNRLNFNRNTAAIAVAMELAKTKNEAVAYVFVDDTTRSYRGYELLLSKYEILQKKEVIILDCIGSADHYHVLSEKSCDHADLTKQWQVIDRDESSVLSLFSNSCMFTRACLEEGEWVVHHTGTRKDDKVDLGSLDEDLEVLQKLIEK